MKNKLITKPCPTCHTPIGIGLFLSRETTLRCPGCGELLNEDPKRKKIGIFINLLAILVWVIVSYLSGVGRLAGLLILPVTVIIALVITRLVVVKKDLVIRNKKTNEITYIDHSDWNEILINTAEKENGFEIIEELK